MSVVIVHGDKGGVGKSHVAITYTEYLLSRKLPVLVIETDTRNADVARVFKAAAGAGIIGLEYLNLRDGSAWLDLINKLDVEEAADVVISLPGQIGGVVSDMAPSLLAALKEMGRKLAVLWVMDRGLDSITLLKLAIASFSEAAQLVAVRNLYWGASGQFSRWADSKTRKEFLAAGGAEMELPDLSDRVTDVTVKSVPPIPFSEYADRGALMGERHALRTWLSEAFAAFDAVANRLGSGAR